MVVGLVGCGRWGRHILRDLRALGCEVPVVARSDESRARAVEGGATDVVDNVQVLAGCDGIVVATPTATHASVVGEALDLDVPVFCEKPLCPDADDARRLADRAPGRLFVMDKWRYHPGVQELAAIARERRLGPVSGVATMRVGWDVPHDDVDAVWILAPHDFSIVFEIMGALPRTDAAAAQLLDGRIVHLSAVLRGDGWWHSLEVSGRSPESTRRIALHCEDGVAVLADGWDQHITVLRDRPDGVEEERIETPGELPLLGELRAFVEHLRGGPAPRSSAAEGAAIVAAIVEVRRRAASA